MDIQISNMTIQDLNQISNTLESDFDEFWNYSVFKDELNSPFSKYLVAKIDNIIVGFIGVKIVDLNADIMNIVVRKDYRGKEIGFKLLNDIIKLCVNMNLKYITLEVNEKNNIAINLYKKFDFEVISTRKNYYISENAIIMRKNLTT